jgi:hypothetical protein
MVRSSTVIGKDAPCLVFRRASIQPNFTLHEVDLTPFERQDFVMHAPACDIRHDDDRRDLRRQMREHALVLFALEKPAPRG